MRRPVVYSAVPTAFTADGELDLASTARIFEHALHGGVDALFVNGTTAEFPSLTIAERRALLRTAVDVAGADRVIAHVGTAAPHHTATLTRDALALGISRLSAITPYYLPTDPDGVQRQLRAVTALAPGAEVFLYVFPDRTGVQLAAPRAAAILDELDLAGIKISIAGTEYVEQVVTSLSRPRVVLSGNDGALPEVVAAGGAGIVSGVSSSMPRPFIALAEAIAAGDQDAETRQRHTLAVVVPILGPSIAGLKLALHLQGFIDSPTCRMALPEPDASARAAIAAAVRSPDDLVASGA